VVTAELRKLNNLDRGPITMLISLDSCKRSKIRVNRPDLYTLLAPEVVKELKISIPGRTAAKCYKHYNEHLYLRLKGKLEMAQIPCVEFAGKVCADLKPGKTEPEMKESEVSSPHKRPRVTSIYCCSCEVRPQRLSHQRCF
jgi:hypothetical protein